VTNERSGRRRPVEPALRMGREEKENDGGMDLTKIRGEHFVNVTI
jgi:hypothetical protein